MKPIPDYLTIYKNGLSGINFTITFPRRFLNTDTIIVEITDDWMVLKIPTLNYLGKTQKLSNNGYNMYSFGVQSDKLKLGKIYINPDDCTEDELVIYLK